jgi:hypothetical protein
VGTGAILEMMAMRKSLPLPEIEPQPSNVKPFSGLIELSRLINFFYVNGQEMNHFYGTRVNKTAA